MLRTLSDLPDENAGGISVRKPPVGGGLNNGKRPVLGKRKALGEITNVTPSHHSGKGKGIEDGNLKSTLTPSNASSPGPERAAVKKSKVVLTPASAAKHAQQRAFTHIPLLPPTLTPAPAANYAQQQSSVSLPLALETPTRAPAAKHAQQQPSITSPGALALTPAAPLTPQQSFNPSSSVLETAAASCTDSLHQRVAAYAEEGIETQNRLSYEDVLPALEAAETAAMHKRAEALLLLSSTHFQSYMRNIQSDEEGDDAIPQLMPCADLTPDRSHLEKFCDTSELEAELDEALLRTALIDITLGDDSDEDGDDEL